MADQESAAVAAFEADVQKLHDDAAALATAPSAATSDRISAIVDPWFVSSMNGTIVSRQTDIYNFIRAAVDDLKARLIKELAS